MNAVVDLSFANRANVFSKPLTLEAVRERAPAVFADGAHESTSAKYTFIPTEQVLSGLMQAGFMPVEARQTVTRKASPLHARHVVRLRRRYETVQLRDSIPEIVFLNSHDGTSAYQLRMGLFRAICTNGMIVSRAAFPAVCFAHRGDIVDAVVAGALQMAERFEVLAGRVERMEGRILGPVEQVDLAGRALTLRYPDPATCGMQPSQLLNCRRVEDAGDDLWTVTNRIQENLLKGGITRRTTTGRLVRTRRITAIKEDVRINSRLWDMAEEVLAA